MMNLFENLQMMKESEENNYYYHRSISKIIKFDLNKSNEIGLHCGTKEQANKFSGVWLYKLNVDTSKMFKIPYDISSGYYDLEFLNVLNRINFITNEEYYNYVKQLRSDMELENDKRKLFSNFYHNLIIDKNYTGFIYDNSVEGKGESICIVDESCIKSCELVQDIILKAVENETELKFEIVDYDRDSVTLKPKDIETRIYFYGKDTSLWFRDYNIHDNTYTFSYKNV